jgi:alkylation response protein AidB-like acyl-CoA dehydrogenase
MSAAASGLERARSLYGLISAEAAASERAGRLTDRVAAAMLEADLFSQLLPVADGGLGATRAQFFETVEAVARADGSAGWCLSTCSTANILIHQACPAEGRREVFGGGPVAAWTALLPSATSIPAAGGFAVSGAFAWGSGSSLADWVVVAEPLPERGGQQWFRSYVVPKSDVAIDPDSWNPMGLRATASVDFRIESRFVPASRSFDYPYEQGDEPGSVSLMFVAQINQTGLTGFASGLGARALAELVAAAPATRRAWAQGSQADDEVTQYRLGEHEGRLTAARGHYLGLLDAQDRHVAEHGVPGSEISLACSHAAVTLAQAARDATVFAFDALGAGVVRASHPLQRCLRDIFTGLKHATFSPVAHSRAGKARLSPESG